MAYMKVNCGYRQGGEIYAGSYVGSEYRVNYQASNNLSIVGGVEYTQNYDVQSVSYLREFSNHSLFTMLDYRFNDKLSVQMGGRVEKYSYFEQHEFMPQFGLVYAPVNNVILNANYSQGFIAPSTWQLQIQENLNSSNISPETFDSYEFNYKHTFNNW